MGKQELTPGKLAEVDRMLEEASRLHQEAENLIRKRQALCERIAAIVSPFKVGDIVVRTASVGYGRYFAELDEKVIHHRARITHVTTTDVIMYGGMQSLHPRVKVKVQATTLRKDGNEGQTKQLYEYSGWELEECEGK